jgi:hypothetical protein
MADTQQFGGKTKAIIAFIVGFVAFQLLFHLVIYPQNNTAPKPTITECKTDSLQSVVDSLQTEIFYLEDGFDSKEHRYEDVISNYELGLSYLKDYHPSAYKDFHRIIGMRERYSHELDRENKQRLKINE